MLDRFAEAALDLSLDLQRRALATEDDAGAAGLAEAFHKLGRALRQTLALKARLRRAEALAEREDRKAEAVQADARKQTRRKQIEAAIRRLAWTEYESEDEVQGLEAELEDHLDELELAPDFADQPLEPQLQAICAALGLPPSSGGKGALAEARGVEGASQARSFQSSA